MYVKNTPQRYEIGSIMNLCWLIGGFWGRENILLQNLDLTGFQLHSEKAKISLIYWLKSYIRSYIKLERQLLQLH